MGLKVLVLAPHPYLIDRGSPIAVDTLLRALSFRGDRVDAVTYPQGEDRRYPGVTVHRPRMPRWLLTKRPGFTLRKLACDFVLFIKAWSLLRQKRYDVIHAGEETVFLAMLLQLIFRVPYIYDMDSSLAQQLIEKAPWLRPLRFAFDACERLAIRRALAVAPVCNALCDLARRSGARRVFPLYDISQLRRPDRKPTGELRARFNIAGPLVLYVGNFEPYQGVDLLLESFGIVRQRGSDATLMLAGGSERHIQAARQRAQALGIADHTHFPGPWPSDRLDELLAEADVVASPRLTGINTPMKVFPYLHSGTALLATDLLTHNQVLSTEVACLAPPRPEPFAEAMQRLIEDASLRRQLGSAGRAFVEKDHVFAAHQQRVGALYDYISSLTAHMPAAEEVRV